jgi:hypothetical protein
MIIDRGSIRFLERQMIRLRPYMIVTILLVAIGLFMLTMDAIYGSIFAILLTYEEV